MSIFGFDLTKFFEGLEDVYNLLCAYNEMQKKKIERLKASLNVDTEEKTEIKENE